MWGGQDCEGRTFRKRGSGVSAGSQGPSPGHRTTRGTRGTTSSRAARACEVQGPPRGSVLVPARPDSPLSSMVPSGPRSPRARSRPCCPLASRDRAGAEAQRLTARGAAPHSTSGALGAGPGVLRRVGAHRLARHSEAPEVDAPRIRDAPLTSGGSAPRDPRPPWSRTVRVARVGGTGDRPGGRAVWAGGARVVLRAAASVFPRELLSVPPCGPGPVCRAR